MEDFGRTGSTVFVGLVVVRGPVLAFPDCVFVDDESALGTYGLVIMFPYSTTALGTRWAIVLRFFGFLLDLPLMCALAHVCGNARQVTVAQLERGQAAPQR
jgi:hypothetical protein